MVSVSFVITGQPRTKKNSQQIAFNRKTGRRFVKQSDIYIAFEKECLRQIAALKWLNDITPITEPVNIEYTFYRADRRKVDLVNLEEAMNDILVRAGVVGDDNYTIVAGHDYSRVRYDKDNPRTEIRITAIKEDR